MKAKVKRIKNGTVVDKDGWMDSFVFSYMYTKEPIKITSKGGTKGKWFRGYPFPNHPDWEFRYHISWLKDIKE
jgi:hypothetical protein